MAPRADSIFDRDFDDAPNSTALMITFQLKTRAVTNGALADG